MGRRARSALVIFAVLGGLLAQAPARGGDYPPQVVRGLTVPAGFAATLYAQADLTPTTLTFGPDSAGVGLASARRLHGTLLYVGGVSGSPFSCNGCGVVAAFNDEHAPVTPNNEPFVADGLNQVLGIAFGPDGTLWVTDNASSRGRVLALKDLDADGYFENKRVVLKNIPTGRHQTNGLTFGPDGMLYVANGNATDDGLECGPPLPPENSVECPPGDVERKPWTGSIIRVDPSWTDVDLLADVRVDGDPFYAEDGLDDEGVLVSSGYRNIYDVDFRPGAPTEIWTPMNGSDDPASSEPLYALDVANEQIVGFDPDTNEPIYGPIIEDAGFPSCLYDPHINPFPQPSLGHPPHPGIAEPQDNLNQAVIDRFGPCQKETILRPRAIFGSGHEGTSGLAFERGAQFPARYDGDLFAAEWGSLWNLNGGTVTGHKIVVFDINPDGSVGEEREFMSGALPMDVTFGPDGMLYMADMTGQIYQVQHVSDAATPDVSQVDMTTNQFVPQAITIVRGATVRWNNTDGTPHTVACEAGVQLVDPQEEPENVTKCPEGFGSNGNVPAGGSYSFTFPIPGVYHYHSTNTAVETNTMRGTVIVLPMER